jgi:2'-5' RNA ligase
MRYFFALWPDENLRSVLVPRRLEVARVCGGRPALESSLHITLTYVGEVAATRLADLLDIGGAVTTKAFSYPINVAACFGKAGVAWFAADSTPPPLHELQQQLQSAVLAAGFPSDPRPFRPHLTVARNISRVVEPWSIEEAPWMVDRFRLVCARSTTLGVTYECVREWVLPSISASGKYRSLAA